MCVRLHVCEGGGCLCVCVCGRGEGKGGAYVCKCGWVEREGRRKDLFIGSLKKLLLDNSL